MHILLCNERFIFRFGVDRVLILYGKALSDRGHTISVMANHLDNEVVDAFASEVIKVPVGGSYIDLNDFTAEWLEANWDSLFAAGGVPDAVVIGGWPFLAAIPVFRAHGVRVLFNDYGVVPLDNYEGGHRMVLERLVELRRQYLPECDAVVAISEFIAQTQSEFDGRGVSVSSNLLGADHMAVGIWSSDNVSSRTASSGIVEAVKAECERSGASLLINLGRWEPGCYKNSEAIFTLVDSLQALGRQCKVLILADPDEVELPEVYRTSVIPIGFPDDAELQAAMAVADLGVSVSLWEGFNLPLAEMQWLEKPVLCFDVGAHPEVVAHPWFLCISDQELAEKADEFLSGPGVDGQEWQAAIRDFKDAFQWNGTIDRIEMALQSTIASPVQIVLDVTNAAIDPANSGVIRVTRRFCRHLQDYCDPVFVLWDTALGAYVYPTAWEYGRLSSFNGPVIDDSYIVSPDNQRLVFDMDDLDPAGGEHWLILSETVIEEAGRGIRRFARRHGFRIGAIFYDAIPTLRPDIVRDAKIRTNHAAYMAGLAECDRIFPISEFSACCLKDFWNDKNLSGPAVVTNLLPGEFGGVEREISEPVQDEEATLNILCVSTLEPRKNHRRILRALAAMSERRPEIDWTFTIIGNRYAGGEDIAREVELACERDSRIRWLGIVDDMVLGEAYAKCSMTIYGSEIEGFGMPILESLWHGKPVLCHFDGVMAESAAGGGCLKVDMTDEQALSEAIEKLASDQALRHRLQLEAQSRMMKSWDDYTQTFLMELLAGQLRETALPDLQKESVMIDGITDFSDWPSLIYKDCLTAEWQMNDSERLGMMALLARLKPSCAVEVGTYRGGSLSLISQYVDCVYSIDIDETIPAKYSFIKNARFFTGQSSVVLPKLLDELTKRDIPVEFVLIDGDHSAAGVRRDVEIMLDYKPTRPMVMMMHDGFNPECRRGMIEAEWARSPYVHFVDLDFIPGRVVETGGGGNGEMWGGLALAYFAPVAREGDVHFAMTSRRAYERALESSVS